jgi:hypothetical protein
MKIKDLIAKTPEVSEEKLLEFIEKNKHYLRSGTSRLVYFHNIEEDDAHAILKEYDKIQEKTSYLSKSQRDEITGFVGWCMIQMVKADGESRSNDTLGIIPEVEEVRDNPESE